MYVNNFKLPYSQLTIEDDKVEKLLKQNVIEPVNSSYNSYLLLIPKKDNDKWRLVIDFKNLNEKIVAENFLLP